MRTSHSDRQVIRTLRAIGLQDLEIRRHTNRSGVSTGLRIITVYDWDPWQHPPIPEIAACLPRNYALEVVFEPVDPDATWMPQRQSDPWSAPRVWR